MFFRLFLLLMIFSMISVERSQAAVNGHTVLKHLVKRWDQEMFGCHCAFNVQCTSDANCHQHGHHYRCIADCCGMKCHPTAGSYHLHHGYIH